MRLLNPAHLVGATRHSLAGLVTAWQNEQAFRHEGIVLGILIVLLAVCGAAPDTWLVVVCAWLLVMVVELLNSAIEKACDTVTLERHPLIKAAKDMASAAIFVTMVMNGLLWLRLLLKYADY